MEEALVSRRGWTALYRPLGLVFYRYGSGVEGGDDSRYPETLWGAKVSEDSVASRFGFYEHTSVPEL